MNFDKTKIGIYYFLAISFYLCYFLSFLGIYYVNATYIHILGVAFHSFVCLYLMWRFNPFREYVLHPFDGQLIFASAMFLFTNVVLIEGASYLKNTTTIFTKKPYQDSYNE